jgi:hypothetical protein
MRKLKNRFRYDSNGYDRKGFDKDGYDREGKDRDGYDRNGSKEVIDAVDGKIGIYHDFSKGMR